MSSMDLDADATRILLIDDNPAIHQDIRKLLLPAHVSSPELDLLAAELFGDGPPAPAPGPEMPAWTLESAYQGREGLDLLEKAKQRGERYALAIVDMRMPPGWDGLETIERLWQVDPDLQIVICTAYSDHSHADIIERLDPGDRLLILRKPFDATQLIQMVWSTSRKWRLHHDLKRQLRVLDQRVRERTEALETANNALREQMAERERVQAELVQGSKQRAVGFLAAGVAHEINTPLQYICDNVSFVAESSLSLMRAVQVLTTTVDEKLADDDPLKQQSEQLREELDLEWLSEELAEAAQQGIDGLGKVRRVVRALMDFAGEDAPPGFDFVSVERAIEVTLEVAQQRWQGKAEVETRMEVSGATVWAVTKDLNQVLLALLTNAVEAAHRNEARPPRVELTVSESAAGIDIAIRDSGTGVPLDVQERMFDPFFTTKDVGSGAGVGLSTCRSIISRHAGRLDYRQADDGGAIFIATFPQTEPERPRAERYPAGGTHA